MEKMGPGVASVSRREAGVSWRPLLVALFVLLLVMSFVQRVEQKEEDSEGEVTGGRATEAKAKTKKLQIGIKKRPEKCDKKSKKGDLLHIHYRGTLEENGVEFDNSYKRGTPLTFSLGMGQVIQGWDQGLLGMCSGEKRKLVIPPDLAYGSAGALPTIPPDATLIFEVECVDIEDKKSEL